MCAEAMPATIESTEDQSQALPGFGLHGRAAGWTTPQLTWSRSVPTLPAPIFWKSLAVGVSLSTTPQNDRGVFAGAGVAAMPLATSSATSGIIAASRIRRARGGVFVRDRQLKGSSSLGGTGCAHRRLHRGGADVQPVGCRRLRRPWRGPGQHPHEAHSLNGARLGSPAVGEDSENERPTQQPRRAFGLGGFV